MSGPTDAADAGAALPVSESWTVEATGDVPRGNGKIAMVMQSDFARGEDIVVINADGSGATTVAGGPTRQVTPRWSPDGTRIAYADFPHVTTGGNGSICVMNADGSSNTNLTDPSLINAHSPAWSPDGSRIAFAVTGEGVCVMNSDGTGRSLVTPAIHAGYVDWSPDGTRILYWSHVYEGEDPAPQIHVINVDGTGRMQLTGPGGTATSPRWSPGGSRILYAGNGGALVVMKPDGTKPRAIGTGSDPTWSPDGTKILFTRFVNGQWGLYTLGIRGWVTRIASGTGYAEPDWQPVL